MKDHNRTKEDTSQAPFSQTQSKRIHRLKGPVLLAISLFILSPAITEAKAPTPNEKDEIIDFVRSGMEAGIVRQDKARFAKLFAQNAVFVGSRFPEKDQFTTVISAQKRLAYTARLPITDSQILSVDVINPQVEISGDTATLTWMINMVWTKGFMQLCGEKYTLTRSEGGWLVTENQYWVLSRGTTDDAQALDAEFWRSMDQRVEEAKSGNDKELLANALFDAVRLSELDTLIAAIPDAEKTDKIWFYETRIHVQKADFEPARRAACASLAAGFPSEYLPPGLIAHCDRPGSQEALGQPACRCLSGGPIIWLIPISPVRASSRRNQAESRLSIHTLAGT